MFPALSFLPCWKSIFAPCTSCPPAAESPGAVLQLSPGAGTCGNLLLPLQGRSLERHCKDTQAPVASMCEEKALQALSTGLSVPFLKKIPFPPWSPSPHAIALFCFKNGKYSISIQPYWVVRFGKLQYKLPKRFFYQVKKVMKEKTPSIYVLNMGHFRRRWKVFSICNPS